MLLRTARGDTQVDTLRPQALFETSSTIPRWGAAWSTWSGSTVNRDSVGGLTAVAAAIRLKAETLAMIPIIVYRGDATARERARDSWQWDLFHESANNDQTAFDFKQDIGTSVQASGDAFVWKAKVQRGRVEQAFVLDPHTVAVKRNRAGRKFFEVRVGDETRPYGPQTILHIRGWTIVPGADRGLSPIAYHRQALGTALSINEFEGRFFRNNASPGGAIEIPGDVEDKTLEAYREQWAERYGGLENAHKPAVLKNGAKWNSIGISLEDAQFIEAKGYGIEEIARIFRISSPSMLSSYMKGVVPKVSDDFERFLKVDLAPEMARIEAAFRTDPDFFPDRDLFPEFLADAVLKPEIKTRYDAYRLARQGGWLTANEIRERENLPVHPDGDSLLVTPVGGAPNDSSPASDD